jgi:hypothetical protein
MNKNIRVQNKEKDKAHINNFNTMTMNTLKHNPKSTYKLQNGSFINYDTYIPPKPKLTSKEIDRLKNTFRIVVNINSL